MELDKLKEFIEFMNEHNLMELEIEEEGCRVKLKKAAGGAVSLPPFIHQPASPIIKEEKNEQDDVSKIEAKSPMVGTFYRAPSPGAEPFVEIGDMVKPGDVLCIIEAMKLMNEIKAETAGRIVNILVENGNPVEFGQTLLVMEPA